MMGYAISGALPEKWVYSISFDKKFYNSDAGIDNNAFASRTECELAAWESAFALLEASLTVEVKDEKNN
jgi:hypothetical protein